MDNIFNQLLYTTLRIECLDEKNNLFSIGTGFLVERPIGNNGSKIYLVSNKHVLCGAHSIAITFTRNNNGVPDVGNTIRFPIIDTKSIVVGHPNPKVDVALLECTGLFIFEKDKMYCSLIPYSMLADFNEPELNVAENVYFVGYPDNRYDVVNNLPLVRTGLISSNPKYDFNGEPVFIIDAQVFPGSSGSPVYIDLTYENMKNGQIVIGQKDIKLLGVVSATMVRNNELQSIQTSSALVTQEVLGLGIVYKATAIKELLDSMPTNN